jgi:integrase
MFFRDTGIEYFTLDELESLAAAWLNDHRKTLAPRTTARRLTSIRRMSRALGMRILEEYNCPTAARPRPHPLPNGKEDLGLLFAATENARYHGLISLMGLCGLRIQEALNVRAHDFNTSSLTLRVVGKGDRERIIPVPPAAWHYLCPLVTGAWANNDRLLSWSDRHAREVITDLGYSARLSRRISSHDLRATFATEAYRKTLNIRAVQELLGHASVLQTQVYVGVADEEMREAADFYERN